MHTNDTQLAEKVRRTLEWEAMVPENSVAATVTNGIVTLEGKVPYTSQRLDAARVVSNLAGVRGVVNKI